MFCIYSHICMLRTISPKRRYVIALLLLEEITKKMSKRCLLVSIGKCIQVHLNDYAFSKGHNYIKLYWQNCSCIDN